MSRINLENSLTYQQRLLAPSFYSTRHVLVGDYVITEESTTYQFLNPNGADRSVFLPEITQGGQFYLIANDGGTGDLEVVDAVGSPITTLESDDIAVFFSSQAEWWFLVSTNVPTPSLAVVSLTFVMDGGGITLPVGVKGDIEVPFPCTINRVTMLADQVGSIEVDIWKDSYGNYPPTVADSIVAAAPPTISGDDQSQDSSLVGWTTAISSGDTLRFNVNSAAAIQRVTVSLKCTKV